MQTDFLVIGSGISGLYLAHLLSNFGEVTIITKDKVFESNTYYAQGGIASVLESDDSFQSHIQDTLKAGAGLCDKEAVKILVEEGPKQIQLLLKLGIPFARTPSGAFDLRQEGGHSKKRIVYTSDFTGKEIENILLSIIKKENIQVLERHSAVELISQCNIEAIPKSKHKNTSCWGAYTYNHENSEVFPIQAKATILATGGAGQVYFHNTNPSVATGDGIALAYRIGASIVNMEFYQFHPTSLYQENKKGRSFLLTEALRGQGALLRNDKGERFLENYDKKGEMASRDIVARAIDQELKKSAIKHVWLDATNIPKEQLENNFSNIYSYLKEQNIDMSKDWLPTVPSAHYMCGGIKTDLLGFTQIEGLYALGEVAYTGVHGANRLASNSLLEALVFASRIANQLSKNLVQAKQWKVKPWQNKNLKNPKESIILEDRYKEIQKIMWNDVGIVRSTKSLECAYRHIELISKEIETYYKNTFIQNKIIELRNLALTAKLIIQSALQRKESRGLHYNIDFQLTSKESKDHTIVKQKSQNFL